MIIGDQRIVRLQNTSTYENIKPTIAIDEKNLNWNMALSNYLNNQWPTSDSEWQRGVFAITSHVGEK